MLMSLQSLTAINQSGKHEQTCKCIPKKFNWVHGEVRSTISSMKLVYLIHAENILVTGEVTNKNLD